MKYSQKTGRIYLLGRDVKFEIPASAIETFTLWNTGPLKNQELYDKLMIEALVFMFVTPEDMRDGKIDDDVVNFIRDFLVVRTGDDFDRMGKMDGYINKICEEEMARKK